MNITAIEMKPVESSQLSALGHDPLHKVMRCAFKNGSVYTYQNVSKEVFESVLLAPSVGKAFSSIIKGHPELYSYSKEA